VKTLTFVLVVLLSAPLLAQDNAAARAARQWRQQHERAIVEEFVELLKIPNVARDRENIRRNADFLVAMMRKRGIEARTISVDGANPLAFGEIKTPGATRTIVFYAHYDGQPVEAREWTTPPWEPTLRTATIDAGGQIIPLPAAGSPFNPEWRLYARSAGDDKAPVIAQMAALDAIRAANIPLKSNIKFVYEGEEEAGSANLVKMLEANKALLSGDVWLMCDGPVHQTRRPLIYFGARDVVTFEVTVYGPKNELHSGHYGNWAHNPAMVLSKLLASIKDDKGRVLVDKFYDGIVPLSATEKRAIAEAPEIDAQLMREFWLGSTEAAPKKLLELITQPSFNIRGLSSSHVGTQANNVVPTTATASIDIRLVKGMDAARTLDRVIEHIRRQGFFVTEQEPTAEVRMAHPLVLRLTRQRVGLGAVRTSMDLPISQEVIRVVESVRGPTIKLPNMGGSLPLAEVEIPLGTKTIEIPIANHDNRQHSSDENLRIQNLWDGIELMAGLLAM
jgi:acetylornithine deacetylase/succinyl-diaminopimelate desuccinylase-like protein